MNSLLDAVDKLEKLRGKDVKVLKKIEKRLERYEVVPVDLLARELGIKPKDVDKYTEPLINLGIVEERNPGYRGLTINTIGRDLLALYDLGLKGKITKIGPQLDVGKEGDIYVAYLDDEPRILKFYRMERKTFRRIEESRSQTLRKRGKKWFVASWRSARRELKALKILWNDGVRVPQPIGRSRHVIEMGYFDGTELVKAKLVEPKEIFSDIIVEVVKMVDAGIVHAELSAYNILVNTEGEVCLIDFPQYISADDPRASEMLRKDFDRIIYHFAHKYSLSESELYLVIERILEEKEIIPSEEDSK